MNKDKQWMSEALICAKHAQSINEVPVGAVCVYQSQLISKGWNLCITNNDPTAHAEIIALRKAAEVLGNYRLIDVDLYVTLEPCCMCAGAIVHSRIRRVIYGAKDNKSGVIDSNLNLFEQSYINHKPKVISSVLQEETSQILVDFFRQKRANQ
ncbi:tRNA adenosine(34) deaminase TadA [Thiotrichales bacterium 19S11-10]|nr:tRNA adenosine(34) deaminase TadA [Thiotrichales bacterium 19S11-10]